MKAALPTLLFLVALQPALVQASSATPHEPIVIDDPGDLLLPEPLASNGVRGGSGTAADPYRISDWTIRPGPGVPAIRIANVPAYFLLTGLDLSGEKAIDAEGTPSLIIADSTLQGDVGVESGVFRLENSTLGSANVLVQGRGEVVFTNVALDDVAMGLEPVQRIHFSNVTGRNLHGIWSSDSEVLMEDSTLEFSPYGPEKVYCAGCVSFTFVRGSVIGVPEPGANASYRGSLVAIVGGNGEGIRFEDATLKAPPGYDGLYVTFQRQNIIRRTTIDGGGYQTGLKANGNLTMEDVAIQSFSTGLEIGGLDAGAVKRAVFRQIREQAIWIWGPVHSLTIDDAIFDGVGCGVAAPHSAGQSESYPLSRDPIDALQIRNSSFRENRECAVYVNVLDAKVDARWNWWGTGEAPPVGWKAEPGLVSPTVQFEPYLRASPHGLSAQAAPTPSVDALGFLMLLGLVLFATKIRRRRQTWRFEGTRTIVENFQS